jgi:hypothetical protein
MSKTLRYSIPDSEYEGCILIDKITYMDKSNDGELTFVHLVNGETVTTDDSINTLEARINSDD